MGFIELFLIAIGLSMDALAISICKGLSVEKIHNKHMIITGLWFGGSQAIMPLLGYILGTTFQAFVEMDLSLAKTAIRKRRLQFLRILSETQTWICKFMSLIAK